MPLDSTAPEFRASDASQSVDSVMRLWPGTMRAFIAYRMLCIGCPIGRLHTIEEACAAHQVDLASFMAALERTAGEGAGSA